MEVVISMEKDYLIRLKSLREENNLSQQAIASVLNVSQRTYSYYENGRTIPIRLLITLAKYYNVSLDYLLGISNKKRKQSKEKELTHS